jgi:glycosyltransferase involved in cell wall biosynthesis
MSYGDRLKEIELSRQCQRQVVYSEYSKAELVRNGFEPARIHIHVPLRSWGAAGPSSSFSERNLVLFAGQIIRGKGVDLLLRALARVRVPFECDILGEGNHRRYCEKLSAKLGLTGRVRFRGFVSPDQMESSYLDASLFAVSSVWPEPFGLVGPEAMRYGLPVVAFDAGGIREWLIDGENGFLVPWMDTDSFAARVQELLINKPLARELGKRGRERVHREYAAPVQVARLERLFHDVLRGCRGSAADSRADSTDLDFRAPVRVSTRAGYSAGGNKALAYE